MLVRVPRPVHAFYAEVMRRKKDDHHASHSNTVNQLFHIVSSSVFLVLLRARLPGPHHRDVGGPGRALPAADRTRHAGAAVPRQGSALLGYNTRNKTLILGAYLLIPAVYLCRRPPGPAGRWASCWRPVAQRWFAWTVLVVAGRVVYLAGKHGVRLALVWFVKLITDPLTDIAAYSPRYLRRRPVKLGPAASPRGSSRSSARATCGWRARPIVPRGVRGPGGLAWRADRGRCARCSSGSRRCRLACSRAGASSTEAPPRGRRRRGARARRRLCSAGRRSDAGVFYRLGSVGVFYGNRFGYDVLWCEAFPFSVPRTPSTSGRAHDLGLLPPPAFSP